MTGSVAAVVVTYNRKYLLIECLDALLMQTANLDRVYVIDNASTDGTSELLRTNGYLANERIEYIKMPYNTGGAGGFHEGIRRAHVAGFGWIWIMDDDAEPASEALSLLRQTFRSEVAAVASLTVGRDGNPQYKHRGWFNFSRKDDGIIDPINEGDIEADELPVNFASFVGLAINRAAIEKIGYPKKEFFIHYDDNEYCIRLSSFGPIILSPRSVIKHKDQAHSESQSRHRRILGRTSERVPLEKLWITYFGLRNRIWLKSENASFIDSFLYSVRWFSRKCVGILLYDDHKYIRMRFFWNAIYDGLSGNFDNDKPKRLLMIRPVTAIRRS
ncbi:MAG TPA: glycosyltransferase family 2 protein [Candidatus Acidoferrales bacterium]|nr:glycosyltransferase family 2 protein [Candidatus Acidoferrales bacterium]